MKTLRMNIGRYATAKLLVTMLCFVAALAIIGCKQDVPAPADTPRVQPATTRILSFGINCKVTIKSDDLFTNTEWNTLCNKVVSAIEREYTKVNGTIDQIRFEGVFATNISINLSTSASNDCTVNAGDTTNIYLKISAIDTVNLQPVVVALSNRTAYP
jgi:ABC-type glycerol-3-phosphate transport system substrate-binding protein